MAKTNTIICSLLLGVFAPVCVHAAVLRVAPAAGSYATGGTFTASVYADSSDQAMNAASVVLSFPKDTLEVVSISKTGSVFSLWPAEPSFSNAAGTVSFDGVVLNPGYTGSGGKLLTVTFRARSTGSAHVGFASASVLANDGSGTDILSSTGSATYTITGAQVPAPATPASTQPTAQPASSDFKGPVISSSTHPNQDTWYAHSAPVFSWELPSGTKEVRTLIGELSSGTPTVSYIPPITQKTVDNLDDGTYYFSLRVRTAIGWSTVSRYRIRIDTTPPNSFTIVRAQSDTPAVVFETTDSGSGIDHYTVAIDGVTISEHVTATSSAHPYLLSMLSSGAHTITVTAVDVAGNTTSSSVDMSVQGIEPPAITHYSETVLAGERVRVMGTTYPNADVTIVIRAGDTRVSEEVVRSNASGDFVYVFADGLEYGTYALAARVTDMHGAQSAETTPRIISVAREWYSDTVSSLLKVFSFVALVLVLIGALVWLVVYLWFRLLRLIRRMRREAREAEEITTHAFSVLKRGVDRHIARLGQKKSARKLTEEELAFLEEFGDKLEEAQDVITKEIHDVLNHSVDREQSNT
jgi:hypothetical protein